MLGLDAIQRGQDSEPIWKLRQVIMIKVQCFERFQSFNILGDRSQLIFIQIQDPYVSVEDKLV